jgi:hypothetical protein
MVSKAPLVSVVVPTFNSASFIRRCLDSIFNQSLKDFELIAVDDLSTDDTIEILNSYSSKIASMTVISSTTKGLPGGARNRGLAAATGKYVSFIDSDDWIDTNFLHVMTNSIEGSGACLPCGECRPAVAVDGSSSTCRRARSNPPSSRSASWPGFWAHNPSLKIICASYEDGLSRKFSRDTRTLMESAFYRRVFPGARLNPRKSTETESETTAHGYRFATSNPVPRPMHAERRAKHLRAIAQGRKWLQELITGKAKDAEAIAAREGRSARSVNMMISLAFVAPDIGVTRLVDLPLIWAEQKTALGLPAKF